MSAQFVSLNQTKVANSTELDEMNRELEDKAKRDKDVHDIVERVKIAKDQPNKGYFVRPYTPRRTNWQSSW
jgi:hypothetical protein